MVCFESLCLAFFMLFNKEVQNVGLSIYVAYVLQPTPNTGNSERKLYKACVEIIQYQITLNYRKAFFKHISYITSFFFGVSYITSWRPNNYAPKKKKTKPIIF